MRVFLTGATGYVGSRLATALVARDHQVRALVRPESGARAPRGCEVVEGSALDRNTWAARVAPCDTFVHLVGVAHPSPAKAREFVEIDLRSVKEAALAARDAGVRHFVYVSVAQPAPVMRAYQAARAEGEAAIRAAGLSATILRPFYVLGPGHYWPYLLVPFYALAERVPSTRDTAKRCGLVTISLMVHALVHAVEHPAEGWAVVGVDDIRRRRVTAP